MNKLCIIFIFLFAPLVFSEQPDPILYMHPLPNSEFVSRQTTLLLRFKKEYSVDKQQINDLFSVAGSINGHYPGKTFFSDDEETIIFKPDKHFRRGEKVTATLHSPYFKNNTFTFQFNISIVHNNRLQKPVAKKISRDHLLNKNVQTYGSVRTINGVTVPSDFPRIDVLINKKGTGSGRLFTGFRQSYFMILENDGTPYFYRKSNDFLMDFKVQPNGYLSRNVDDRDTNEHFYITMDHTFNYVDTFAVKHGYHTDHHDFQLLPDGHSLLICNDIEIVDMSKIVDGGHRSARVFGHHFQELDSNKNVVFEWRGWDHLDIKDAIEIDLTDKSFDYAHMNSICLDYDGHYLISCRNLSQCLKINRNTGEIMWVMGGKSNSFTFINDTDQNSYQHMIRPVPGKPNHYTLFDNGNHHNPSYSRAVEFKVDTTAMTIEKVWEYHHDPELFAGWLGSVQRLPNGNTLINWTGHGRPFANEVTPEGEVVYEAEGSQSLAVYRTYRFDWQGKADRPYLLLESMGDRIILIFNKFGDDNVDYYKIYEGQTPHSLTLFDTTSATRYDAVDFKNHSRHYFKVTAVDKTGQESTASETKGIDVKYVNPGENIIKNGNFAAGKQHWNLNTYEGAQADGTIVDDSFKFVIHETGSAPWHIQLKQTNIPLYQRKQYRFEFDAYAENRRTIEAKIVKSEPPYTNYGKIGRTALSQREKHVSYDFVMNYNTDLDARVVINCGGEEGNVFIDNISLKVLPSTDVASQKNPIPEEFQLFQNHPNPFNSNTSIRFSVSKSAKVHLTVYDVLGQQIRTLVSELKSAGEHERVWNGEDQKGQNVPSGLYMCRMRAFGTVKTIKLLLVR